MPKLRPLPSPDEARAGLHAAAASAEEHLAVAELLAGAGHYGSACSHLILAQEETVKARALGWIWIDRGLEQKTYNEREIRERLSGHPPRHKAAIVQSWSGGLQSEIVARSLREAIRNQAARQGMSWPDLQREVTQRGKHLPDIPTREAWEDELRQSYPQAVDDDWPAQAADLKNRGFYADQVEGGTWRSPGEVTTAEYEATVKKVRPMVELLGQLIVSSGA